MGLFVCLLALAPVRCLYATACVADAGVHECGSSVDEQHRSTLIQQTQSLSKSPWSQNLVSFGKPSGGDDSGKEPDYSKYPVDEPLEEQHLMKEDVTAGEASIADALALTLIGAVLAIACVIYLINWPDKDIERATWKVLSESLMIFCAVLFFDALLKSTQFLNGEHPEPTLDTPGHAPPAHLWADLIRVLVIFILFEVVMHAAKNRRGFFEPFGFMGSHILGFAIIQFAANLQQTEPWNSSVVMALLLTCMAAFVVIGLFAACNSFRDRCMQAPKQDKHSRSHFEHWKNLCIEFQDEACGLAIGLLICQTIKFLITGVLPPVHGAPRDKTKKQVRLLGMSALCFSGLVALLSQFLHSSRKYHKDSRLAKRSGHVLFSIASMAEGWCMLYWGIWLFWNTTGDKGVGEGDVMTARLMLVVFFGTIGFSLIFIINFLAHRGLMNLEEQRSLIDSVGLLLGLTWESCINAAMEGLHHSLFQKRPEKFRLCDGGTDLIIALVVSPAWAWYILPRAMALVHGGMELDEQKQAVDAWADDDDDDDETTCCCAPIGR